MELTSKERVGLALARKEADRIPRMDGFWPETIQQWERDGMPVGLDIGAHFGFDFVGAGWVNHEARVGFSKVVAEDERSITREDGNGTMLRFWKGKSGTPEHTGFTVNCADKWLQFKRHLLDAPIESRVNVQDALAAMHKARSEQKWFTWTGVEAFETAKDILGHEYLCCAMAEEPDLARDVFETETEIAIRALNHLEKSGVQYDGGWIFGDIAYNKGPFCSPRMYKSLVQPSHARQIGWFKERGLKLIYHTDGDFRPLIPGFIEAGVDCVQPMEAKAQIDVRELKPRYGDRVAFMGNIDAMKLISNDRDAIEEEIASKISVAKVGGGYIYHSDHSVPPGITWETYQFVMERVAFHGAYA
jgi:uroporphyrinogen decarboxylase